MVFRVVYTSRASRSLSENEIATLGEKAGRDNLRNQVSGLLLFDGLRFLQAAEGEIGVVEDLMARILADPRHFDVDYLQRSALPRREFEIFAMRSLCYPVNEQSDFVEFVKRAVVGLSDAQLKAHIIGFAKMAAGHRAQEMGSR